MHPSIDPFASGHLTVADGSRLYWETSGNPAGIPALFLHGGPGSGLGRGGYRRRFDPDRYLIVGLDQRGCGRSTPLATASLAALETNTTAALIGDIEELRQHLAVERWLVSGVSWGSTLALAYAQARPDRVTRLVLVAVTTTSRAEVDWITEGIGRVFPEAWATFDRASGRVDGERAVDAYARVLAHGTAGERAEAAKHWDRWESTHISLDPHFVAGPLNEDPTEREVFARLVTHYWSNSAFLADGSEILNRMDRIAHLPGELIHGRRDLSGPAITPWQLHQRWPASTLTIVEDEGHGGPVSMQLMTEALDRFASG